MNIINKIENKHKEKYKKLLKSNKFIKKVSFLNKSRNNLYKDFYEILLKSKNYGTYNLASPMASYHDRIVQICKENKINFEKLLVPTLGNIIPLEQNIDCSKFKRIFNLKMS